MPKLYVKASDTLAKAAELAQLICNWSVLVDDMIEREEKAQKELAKCPDMNQNVRDMLDTGTG